MRDSPGYWSSKVTLQAGSGLVSIIVPARTTIFVIVEDAGAGCVAFPYEGVRNTFAYSQLCMHYRCHIMRDVTTIQLEKSVVEELRRLKMYPRQTYNELIMHLVRLAKSVRASNQYDEFLHKVQQEKMRELWDNTYDEEWEDA